MNGASIEIGESLLEVIRELRVRSQILGLSATEAQDEVGRDIRA